MTVPAPTGLPLGIARVICSGAGGTGDVWSNVFHINTPTPLPTLPQAQLDAFVGFYSTLTGGDVLGLNFTLSNIQIRRGSQSGSDIVTDHTFSLIESSANATPLPPQNCIAVTWRTVLSGRSFRGRTYVGPLGTYVLNGAGKVNAGSAGTILSAANGLRTSLQTAGTQLGVYSRTRNIFTDITTAAVGLTVDTQRRRRSALPG